MTLTVGKATAFRQHSAPHVVYLKISPEGRSHHWPDDSLCFCSVNYWLDTFFIAAYQYSCNIIKSIRHVNKESEFKIEHT